MAKKTAKKVALKKKAPKKKATPEQLFSEWWEKKAVKKVNKIEKAWLDSTEPNGEEDEDEGTDSWCVNQMMHNGDAHEMTYEIAERVFLAGYKGEKWEFSMGDSLFCELDQIINDAYLAGKEMVS
jgi:hypothetical protein